MPTLRFRKLFASLFVFASLCVGAQAATYWWTGGTAGNWSNPENWSTGPDIEHLTAQAAGAPVPGSDTTDIVNLISAATITVSSNVQIAQLLIPNPNLENSDFTITLTGSGSINATTKIDPVRAAGPSAGSTAKSTFVFDCDVSSAELIMHSGGDVTITEGTKATISTISNPGGAFPSTMLTVNGTLISNSISLSDTTTRQMTVGPNAIVTAGTLTGSNASVTNNGLIVSNGDISSVIKEESTGSTAETGGATGFVWTGASSSNWSIASNWLNGTAPTSASDNISIPNVTTKPVITSGDTVAITASKLTIVNGADITVNGTLNITGDLDLASKINILSSGTLSVSGELSNSADFSATGLALSCGTLTATQDLTCKSLSVTGAASFNSNSNLTLQTTGTTALSFGSTLSKSGTGNLSITSGGAVTFSGTVTQPANTGDLTINSSGAVTFNDSLTHAGSLTITSTDDITFAAATQTSTLSITATGKDVTFSNTLASSSALSVTAANLTFSDAATVKDITMSATTSTASNMTVTGNWTNNGSFTASGGTVTFTTAFNDTDYSDIDGSGSNNFNNLEIQRNIQIKKNVSTSGNFTAVKKADNSNMGGRNIYFGNNVTLTVGGDISLLGNSNTNSNRLRLCGLEPNSDAYHWTLNCTGSQSIQYTSIKGCTANPPLLAIDSTDLGGNTDLIFPGMTYTWQGGSGTGASRNDWNTANNWNPKSIPTAGAKVTIPAGRTYYPILTADLTMGYDATYTGSITIEASALFDIAGQSLSLGTITNEGTLRLNGASGQSITGTMINSEVTSTIEYYDSTGSASFNSLVWDGNASAAGNQFQNLIISMPLTSSEQLSVAGTSKIAAGTGKTVSLNNASNQFSGHISIGDSVAPTSAGIVTLKGSGNSGTAIYLENSILADNLTLNSKAQGDSPTFDTALTINAESITTTGAQTYKKAVTINEDTSLTSAGGGITFESTAPLSNPANSLDLSVPAASSITFAGAVGNSTTAFNSLKISQAKDTSFAQAVYITTFIDTNNSGNIIFSNSGTINTTGGQTFNTSGKVTFGDAAGDVMNFGSSPSYLSLTHTNGDTEINGTLNAADITLAKTSINGNINGADITCDQTTVVNAELSGSVITFTDTVSGTGLTINQSTSTTFDKTVTLNSFADNASHTGSITFKKGGNIASIGGSTPNTLNTSGVLTLGEPSVTPYPSLTISGNMAHTAGDTVIYGTLNAGAINLAKLTGGEITITNSGTLTLPTAAPVTCSKFIQNGTGSVSLGRDITASTGNIFFAKEVTINADSTLSANSTNGGITFSDNILSAVNSKLTLVSNEKDIIISGTVGASSTHQFYSLEIQGTSATPAPAASISAVFNNSVYINTFADTSYTGNITFKDGGTISTPGGQTFSTSGKVTFGDATTDTMNFGSTSPYLSLTHSNGDTEINGSLNAANITLAKTTVTGIINGGSIQTDITNIENSIINGTSFSTGTFTSTGTSTIETTGTQNYNDTFTAENVSIQGSTINFGSTAQANSFTLSQATSTIFTGAVTITTFTDTSNSGSITFAAGGTITAVTGNTFNTSGAVTIGTSGAATPPTLIVNSDVTHNAQTNIFGTLSTPSKNVTLGTTVIQGTISSNDISLGTTSGGPITLIGHDITLNQNLTSNSSITITNSELFKTDDGKNIIFGNTSSADFTQNGSGNSSLGGSFTGNGNAAFATDLLLYGNSAATFGTTGKNITIGGTSLNKNLIISRGAACTINADTSAQNIVLYKGALNLSADLTANKDIVILGNNGTPASDLYKDASTGLTEEYIYANTSTNSRPSNWSQANYNATTLPDGTSVPATGFTASLSVANGKTVTAGKNFYANNTSLTGTGSWNLKVPDLTNPANGFAEAYHSVVSNCNVICSDGSSDGSKARLVTLECTNGGSNPNVDFGDFEITDAYTVRDNVVYVEFNRPIRYLAAAFGTTGPLHFSDGSFTAIYSDQDCTSQITSDITVQHFYIKASGAWNTDATGKSAGATDKSSDRNGIHHDTKPYLDFPRALSGMPFILTDIWGKRLNNYSQRVSLGASAEPAYGSTADTTHDVEDKTGPVLWTVRTGQELHTPYDTAIGETSQHSYDSHNFLEFRYSEPVDIGSGTGTIAAYSSGTTPNVVENIQVTDTLGAITGNITSPSSEITFAGLAKLTAGSSSSLQLYTGSNGSADKYVNALYRQDEYSIRLSLAGWTDGTVADYAGNSYKKWPGYIEAASQFTGASAKAVAITNTLVTDQAGNHQIEYAVGTRTEPTVLSDNSGTHTASLLPDSPNLYSPWDISSPVFTPLRFSAETNWGEQEMSEAIGNTNGSGSTLDRIDFHFFDNTPAYDNTDSAEWYTEIGWCNPNSDASKTNLKAPSYSYAADIIGGARPFATDSSRTIGGIRFSTKTGISPAFRYSTSPNNPSPSTAFQTGIANVHTTVVSQLFTGSSTPMRPANDPDGLYLGLGLTDTNLSVETTFAFSYNDSLGYLTDLAGNRLRSKTSKTIDRTPPSFDVILSPVDTNAVYLIFVKQLVTDSSRIKFRYDNGNNVFQSPYPDFLTILPRCFRIISIDASGNAIPSSENQIDTSVPAEIVESFSNDSFTCIKLTTTNKINIENLKNLYVQLITPDEYPQTGTDPLTNNTGSRVTLIQDYLGNYMSMYSAHALSDFAINYVNPLYAYSTDMLYEDQSIMNGLYEAGSWAVHDWNADQQNYGTLPAEYPVSIVADTKGNDKIRIYLSAAPDADAVSKQFNSDFKVNFRIWLPALQDGLFRALSASNNINFDFADGSLTQSASTNSLFNISKDIISKWKSGNQISFMFGLMDNGDNPVRIYNNPYYDVATDRFNLSLSIPVPLYCLRLKDANDLKSLDLWSFKLKGIKSQRGGVTILNNVINASNEEKAVVIVDMPEDGKLTVCIMTLDGNIITYLNRGNTKAGQYYYTWNGKNKAGNSVARGMYFVRVIGGGIDETRKVMVVKDN